MVKMHMTSPSRPRIPASGEPSGETSELSRVCVAIWLSARLIWFNSPSDGAPFWVMCVYVFPPKWSFMLLECCKCRYGQGLVELALCWLRTDAHRQQFVTRAGHALGLEAPPICLAEQCATYCCQLSAASCAPKLSHIWLLIRFDMFRLCPVDFSFTGYPSPELLSADFPRILLSPDFVEIQSCKGLG